MEVDPRASTPYVGGTRAASRRSRAIIVSLRLWTEMVVFPTGVIEKTGVLLKGVSGEGVFLSLGGDQSEFLRTISG